MTASGFIVAAPSTGSGKTLLTIGLLRAFARQGLRVGSFKAGPDYIDPAFHMRATGGLCVNLDPWSMRRQTLTGLAAGLAAEHDLVVGEGVMGLFDGAPDGSGTTADLAALLGLPVILVIDASSMGASVAAVAKGFLGHRQDVDIAGIVLNKVASENHARLLLRACREHLPVPVLGCLRRNGDLALPSRHLGLVQAREQAGLDGLIDRAADLLALQLDLPRLRQLARSPNLPPETPQPAPLAPLGQRIAVADDDAFAFAYPAIMRAWRNAGAEIMPFSPLADEPPASVADAVFLPGGYPELHAARLADCHRFKVGMERLVAQDAAIYGECGGFMVLGRSLVDQEGRAYPMCGLLPVETSFAQRRLQLGYRAMTTLAPSPLGAPGTKLRGHEFHYASLILNEAPPFFSVCDALGERSGDRGACLGRVAGSFLHVVDRAI